MRQMAILSVLALALALFGDVAVADSGADPDHAMPFLIDSKHVRLLELVEVEGTSRLWITPWVVVQ